MIRKAYLIDTGTDLFDIAFGSETIESLLRVIPEEDIVHFSKLLSNSTREIGRKSMQLGGKDLGRKTGDVRRAAIDSMHLPADKDAAFKGVIPPGL